VQSNWNSSWPRGALNELYNIAAIPICEQKQHHRVMSLCRLLVRPTLIEQLQGLAKALACGTLVEMAEPNQFEGELA
jgi:hypothetical protein